MSVFTPNTLGSIIFIATFANATTIDIPVIIIINVAAAIIAMSKRTAMAAKKCVCGNIIRIVVYFCTTKHTLRFTGIANINKFWNINIYISIVFRIIRSDQ